MLTKFPKLRHTAIALVIGAIVGLVAFGLTFILEKYVFTPIGCVAESTIVRCEDVTAISHNVALLLALGLGLTLLVRVAAFRPLLVILASVIALWGIGARLATVSWPAELGLTVFIFGMIFVLFSWLAMPRRFWVSGLLIVATLVMLRIALVV